jgi:uncharacterized repeat protein (TIGR03847 family)
VVKRFNEQRIIDMSQELPDFDLPDYFEAEALGQPGNRRFRLIAGKGRRTACLWLERADVELLVQGIQQTLVEIAGSDVLRVEGEPTLSPAPPPRTDFPSEPNIEFQVGRWALGYDQESTHIIFVASSLALAMETTEEDEMVAEFRVALTRGEAERFAQQAESVIAAGRPRCPLCGVALSHPGEAHGCVKQNGHKHLDENA